MCLPFFVPRNSWRYTVARRLTACCCPLSCPQCMGCISRPACSPHCLQAQCVPWLGTACTWHKWAASCNTHSLRGRTVSHARTRVKKQHAYDCCASYYCCYVLATDFAGADYVMLQAPFLPRFSRACSPRAAQLGPVSPWRSRLSRIDGAAPSTPASNPVVPVARTPRKTRGKVGQCLDVWPNASVADADTVGSLHGVASGPFGTT